MMFSNVSTATLDTKALNKVSYDHLEGMIDELAQQGVVTNAAGLKRCLVAKLDWARNRTRSLGGLKRIGGKCTPFMSIGMRRSVAESDKGFVAEYKSFNRDREIGGANVRNAEEAVMVVVAHELAHVIQFCRDYAKRPELAGLVSDQLPSNDRPHGYLFQLVYRTIRRNYVNPRLGGVVEQPRYEVSEPRMVARKEKPQGYKNRAELVRIMIRHGYENEAIVEAARAQFPKVQTGAKEVNWYRWQLRKASV